MSAASAKQPAGPTDAQVEEFNRVLTDFVKKYQFRDKNSLCFGDLSVSQCYTLRALESGESLTMSQLADDVYLDVSTMTRVVDKLIEKKLVRRLADPSDRRVNRIEATPKGASLARQVSRDLIARERAVLETLPRETRRSLVKGLRELSRAVDDWRSG